MVKLKTAHEHEYGKSRVTGVVTLEFDDNGISQELTDEQAESLSFSKSLSLVVEDAAEDVEDTKNTKNTTEEVAEDTTATEELEDVTKDVTEESTEETEVPETTEEVVELTEDDKSTDLYKTLTDSSMKEIKALLTDAKVSEDVLKSYNRAKGKDVLIQFAYPILKKTVES